MVKPGFLLGVSTSTHGTAWPVSEVRWLREPILGCFFPFFLLRCSGIGPRLIEPEFEFSATVSGSSKFVICTNAAIRIR